MQFGEGDSQSGGTLSVGMNFDIPFSANRIGDNAEMNRWGAKGTVGIEF